MEICGLCVARIARDTSLHSTILTIWTKLNGYLQHGQEATCRTESKYYTNEICNIENSNLGICTVRDGPGEGPKEKG
jgi:hypothetical protein